MIVTFKMIAKQDFIALCAFLSVLFIFNWGLDGPPATPGDTHAQSGTLYFRQSPVRRRVQLHECTGKDGMVGHGFHVIKWAVQAWAAENDYNLDIVQSTYDCPWATPADYDIQYYGVGGKLRCEFPFKTFKIAVAGEVFEGNRPCRGADFILDRQINREHNGCPTVHYYQGLSLPHYTGWDLKGDPWLCDDVPPEADLGRDPGPILTVSEVYKKVYDHADAVVRSSILGMLAAGGAKTFTGSRLYHHVGGDPPFNYSKVNCYGTDIESKKCKSKYLFDVEMENTAEPGYTSEKLLVGVMAGSIPIYWGDLDHHTADTVFNPNRYIRCEINRTAIRRWDLEVIKLRNHGDQLKLHKWAVEKFTPELAPCVAKVRRVMGDRDLQKKILTQRGLSPWVCAQKIPNAYTAGNMSLYMKTEPK